MTGCQTTSGVGRDDTGGNDCECSVLFPQTLWGYLGKWQSSNDVRKSLSLDRKVRFGIERLNVSVKLVRNRDKKTLTLKVSVIWGFNARREQMVKRYEDKFTYLF